MIVCVRDKFFFQITLFFCITRKYANSEIKLLIFVEGQDIRKCYLEFEIREIIQKTQGMLIKEKSFA